MTIDIATIDSFVTAAGYRDLVCRQVEYGDVTADEIRAAAWDNGFSRADWERHVETARRRRDGEYRGYALTASSHTDHDDEIKACQDGIAKLESKRQSHQDFIDGERRIRDDGTFTLGINGKEDTLRQIASNKEFLALTDLTPEQKQGGRASLAQCEERLAVIEKNEREVVALTEQIDATRQRLFDLEDQKRDWRNFNLAVFSTDEPKPQPPFTHNLATATGRPSEWDVVPQFG
ncbi:MAG: hypothetical protein KDA60_16105 [Planctomycetales bacterium]|nr:hypothetical protein [Planctomycetales bacterium]